MPPIVKAARECDVSLRDSMQDRFDIVISVINENYMYIAAATAWVAIILLAIYMLLSRMRSIFVGYHRNVTAPTQVDDAFAEIDLSVTSPFAGGFQSGDNDEGSGVVTNQEVDDYPVKGTVPIEPPSDRAIFASRIAALKQRYAKYNKEITDYSRDVLKQEPTDVYDERIISRKSDTY